MRCGRVTVNACQITDGFPRGLYVRDSRRVTVTGCTIADTRDPAKNTEAVFWEGCGEGNRFSGNSVGPASGEGLRIEPSAGVQAERNDLV